MVKTAAVLTLVLSTSMCKLDNVSTAEVYRVPVSTVQECEEIAASLGRKEGINAYCEAQP